jgi:putative hydrolase of the HAD superfamily
MIFYRRLLPFHAISFDLDDTLYSNHPIMQTTDKKMVGYFTRVLADYGIDTAKMSFNFRYWFPFRQQAIARWPLLKHDVGLLRQKSYLLGALALGLDSGAAEEFANSALAYFIQQRSNFTLPQHTHDFLAYLKRKRPLAAITNGNVDTDKIGISQYFSHHFHASIENRLKPDADMFNKTCLALDIKPAELLHVGDCGKNDVLGGINAGCQTAWLNQYHVGKPLTVLPTLALDHVEQLASIVR